MKRGPQAQRPFHSYKYCCVCKSDTKEESLLRCKGECKEPVYEPPTLTLEERVKKLEREFAEFKK